MNISATLNRVVDIDNTITGNISVDTSGATGSTRLEVKVTYTSSGGVFTSTPVTYNGSSTSTFTFTNGTTMTINQSTGDIAYTRLSSDVSDDTLDTYTFEFKLTDDASTATATKSVTTVPNISINTFTANSAVDTAYKVTGHIALQVIDDTNTTIGIGVSSSTYELGVDKAYSNGLHYYSWTLANGCAFSIDTTNGVWEYMRPSADVGNLISNTYGFGITLRDSTSVRSRSVSVTTAVTYPPSISNFSSEPASDNSNTINGTLAMSYAALANVTVSVSRNGYMFNGSTIENTGEKLTWNYSDGSKFEWDTTAKTWVFTRASENVGDNSSDTYVFSVSVASSVGSDAASCSVDTVVPKAVINGFTSSTTMDVQDTVVGVLDVTMPDVSNSPKIKVDLTRNGVLYTDVEYSLGNTDIVFQYADGSKFTYSPATSSFTYKRPDADVTDASVDTYVFDITITVNRQVTNASLVAKTLAGKRIYAYETAYPIHFSAGATETQDSAWPKVILEFERVYRLLNENMNYYEGLFKELDSKMEQLTKELMDELNSMRSGMAEMFPIGTILAFSKKPKTVMAGWYLCNGENGTPNLTGRFLEGVTANNESMRYKEAGLPNITGKFIQGCWDYEHDWGVTSGAFYLTHDNAGECAHKGDSRGICDFNASRSSAVYGKSTTVQPASCTVYYYMRVK